MRNISKDMCNISKDMCNISKEVSHRDAVNVSQ